MKKVLFPLLFVLIGVLASAQASEADNPELVDAAWLVQNLNRSDILLLDIQESQSFVRHHLPGAVNIPYSRWRSDEKSAVPGNLLSPKAYQAMLGKAGISHDNHLVIVATGLQPGDLSASARVFWTLRLLGHRKLSLLDGGLADFARQRLGPLERGVPEPRPATTYQGLPNMTLLARADDVKASQVRIDARSPEEYMGLMSGGEGERAGTVPGSVNLPYSWLTDNASSGKLLEPEQLKTIFAKAGVGEQDGGVHFCHTGNRASLTWFVDYAIRGNRGARLYDASMLEWAADAQRPIDQKWEL